MNEIDYKIISIGSSCFIADEMKKIGQRYESMPFDYIETNLYLINDFFIDPEKTFELLFGRWSRTEQFELYKGNGFVYPRFPHHCPDTDLDHFKRAYIRLMDSLTNEKIKILFVHINTPYFDKYNSVVPIEQIETLRDIKNSLIKYYPSLKFDILSINPYVVDNFSDTSEEWKCYKIYHEEPNLTIIQPCCTVPLYVHWGIERDIWNKIWTEIFIKFNINFTIPI